MNAYMPETNPPLLVTYTLFPDVTPRDKTERADVPWEEFVARIRNAATYIDKAHCPLVSFSEYGAHLSDKGCIRNSENVRRVFGAEFDYDGEVVTLATAVEKLQQANIAAVLYTSPSHQPSKPRWRAIFPFSEPTLPEKRAEYLGRANQILGGIASRESFTLSQSFYIGRVRGAPYEMAEVSGRCLDVAFEIEPLYHQGHVSDGGVIRDQTTDADLRLVIGGDDEVATRLGLSRYEAMPKLSSRLAARGMGADDIVSVLLEALGPSPARFHSNGQDPRAAVHDMASSAVRKFGETRRPSATPPHAQHTQRAESSSPQPSGEVEPPIRRAMDWEALEGREPPARVWRVSHWLTTGPTLLAGKGGVGKTMIAQTIATALALGRRFVDDVHGETNVLIWACEDDHDELWRRQLAICRFFGVPLSALKGKLTIEPRLGLENTLFDMVYGAPIWTPLRQELATQIRDYRARVLFLDNIGQTYGGKENDRHHVTMFINGLVGLVGDLEFSVVIMGHPSKSADSEFSGSTAWENGVRMRWYMGHQLPDQKPEEGAVEDPNVRYLAKRKANYSDKDYRKLTFENGLFVPEREGPGDFTRRYGGPSRQEGAEACIIFALQRLKEAGIRTTDAKNSPDYLPRRMHEMQLAADFTTRELGNALAKMRLEGKVIEGQVGRYPNRTPKIGLVLP